MPGKHFHFLKKLTKHSKGKNFRSSVVLESTTDEGVLGISETAVDLQEAKGREVLITAEKKENICK